MFIKSLTIISFCIGMASIIFGLPPLPDNVVSEADKEAVIEKLEEYLNSPDIDLTSRVNLNTLFNLSGALASAPNNTAALGFIPLATIFSGFGR